MKKRKLAGRVISAVLSGIMLAGSISETTLVRAESTENNPMVEEYIKSLPTLTVDMSRRTGEILHGASGFLYGISNEDVPTTNTLVPLKPKVLATKGALGTEHPYGDALDVAETFLSSGGEQVMMYNSNYYGVFGVTANYKDYAEVLETVIAPYVYRWKQEWKQKHGTPDNPKDELGKTDIDKAIIYIPINEGTPVNGAISTNVAWKTYYDAIKKGDPDATLAGPNSCAYNQQFVRTDFRGHIQYCADNDCMPDIITWHELQTDTLYYMSIHMDDFRAVWKSIDWTKWLETHETTPDMPQIVINEYAEMKDCGVPGALVNWIARLEDEKIYGCLPFWQQANNLNGLTSDANEGASAWWVYKWYGDMSGQTLRVTTSTAFSRLYGVATLDDNKKMASVLMGGEDGIQRLVLSKLTETETFKNADKVHVKVQKAEYNGYAGTVNETQVLLDGIYEVKPDGSVEVLIPNATFADAFYVTVTQAGETQKVEIPQLRSYSKIYEAENASIGSLAVKNKNDYMPTYYFSNEKAVLMSRRNDEIVYEIDVPVDGNYNLHFIYGNGTGSNRNNMNAHKPKNITQQYSIDGHVIEDSVIMENTLFTAITDCYEMNVDLKAGKHTVAVKNLENGTLIHDALRVVYEGNYGSGNNRKEYIFEAEQADFNTLSDCKNTSVVTDTALTGFSENGYVKGLNLNPVVAGGGIRFNVVVKESGIYNLSLRYQSETAGVANIYIGNTVTSLDSFATGINVGNTGKQWETVTASVFLQKGINIVDIDADADIALDYMKVAEIRESELTQGIIQQIEAENCIPVNSTLQVKESKGASNGLYVVGMEGNAQAREDINKYLEFEYEVTEPGVYALTLFQSNNDICGSHSYNIKIIDKYASIMVMDASGKVTEEKRYFFINSSSDDTFKEKSVYVTLHQGKNTIRIFNDDSWHVTWGGTTETPGTNILYNYAPNFDRFVITKAVLNRTVCVEATPASERKVTFGTVNVEEYMENNTVLERDEALVDETIAYFVDCGDHGTDTVTTGDLFGRYNGVTDKIYGVDFATGYKWGVLTSGDDPVNPRGDGGVYTVYQWANEWDTNDGLDKTKSFRYAHNQLESGIKKRYVKYKFELEPGEYEVEVCMGNNWGNSANPEVFVDENKIHTERLSIPQNGNKTVSSVITVAEKSEIVVAAYSDDATINMNYIKISILSVTEEETVEPSGSAEATEPEGEKTSEEETPAEEILPKEQIPNKKTVPDTKKWYAVTGVLLVLGIAGALVFKKRKKNK